MSIASIALAALSMTTAAAASAVLTVGSTSGPAVAGGDALSGTGNVTFANAANPSQNVMLPMGVGAEDVTNPAPPAMVALTVSSMTFSKCTLNGFRAAISKVPFTRTSVPATTCFLRGSFSATFGFTDTTQGGGSVFVN